jgi:hypothetical protein
LDGPLPKWCPAVALSHQDGHHSAVALLLKAALIQVSDYRLLGASGVSTATFFLLHCDSAETQVCHRSYIIAASFNMFLIKVFCINIMFI